MAGAPYSIAVVGPCAAGKTTLAQGLAALGYQARQITQEHSHVPNMWQVISPPDYLIYLDASHDICQQRKHLQWEEGDHQEQLHRLRHARAHCDLYIRTDELTPAQVLERAVAALQSSRGQRPNS